MDDIVVSTEGVTKLLKGLNPSNALEPDELYSNVIQNVGETVILFHFSNQAVPQTTEVFPYIVYWVKCLVLF